MDNKLKVAYVCDRKACEKCSDECSHTHDLEHALHKNDLQGRIFRCINDSNGVIGFFEMEKPERELEWYDDEQSDWERGYNACLDTMFYKG